MTQCFFILNDFFQHYIRISLSKEFNGIRFQTRDISPTLRLLSTLLCYTLSTQPYVPYPLFRSPDTLPPSLAYSALHRLPLLSYPPVPPRSSVVARFSFLHDHPCRRYTRYAYILQLVVKRRVPSPSSRGHPLFPSATNVIADPEPPGIGYKPSADNIEIRNACPRA